jgi:hypothetical protein
VDPVDQIEDVDADLSRLLVCYTTTLLHCYTATLLHCYTATLLCCFFAHDYSPRILSTNRLHGTTVIMERSWHPFAVCSPGLGVMLSHNLSSPCTSQWGQPARPKTTSRVEQRRYRIAARGCVYYGYTRTYHPHDLV